MPTPPSHPPAPATPVPPFTAGAGPWHSQQGVLLAEVTHWQPQLPIGILPQEYDAPQPVDICVQVAVKDTGLGLAHNLEGSFDYRCIFEAVNTLAAQGHIDLLEAVTEAVAQACLHHPLVLGVWVRVHKLALVPHCHSVGIERTFTPATPPFTTKS